MIYIYLVPVNSEDKFTNPPQHSLIREGYQIWPSPDKGRWPQAGGVCKGNLK